MIDTRLNRCQLWQEARTIHTLCVDLKLRKQALALLVQVCKLGKEHAMADTLVDSTLPQAGLLMFHSLWRYTSRAWGANINYGEFTLRFFCFDAVLAALMISCHFELW